MSSSQDPSLKPVLLALPSVSPALAVEILPFGLTIHRILVNGDGKTHDLLIGPHDVEDQKRNRAFLHTIVGRYSNRVPVGEYELEKDGHKGSLSVTATESPQVQLHGGADGFDRRVFEEIETGNATLFSASERQAIAGMPSASIFKLTSPDGDQGYPGKLYLEVLFALTEPASVAEPQSPAGGSRFSNRSTTQEERLLGSLIVVYRAKVVDEGKVTPINLTQHWGFNLDASLAEVNTPTPSVMDQKLTIKSSNTLALHANGLATGALDPSAGTSHEHESKKIGLNYPSKGYDSYYLFDSKPSTSPIHVPLSSLESLDAVCSLASAPGSNPPTTLASDNSGIKLTFETNQPGVQFYSAVGLDGTIPRKKIHGGSGGVDDPNGGYNAGAAAFLEFHEPLAAWLHPWGANGEDTLLTSQLLYNNFTKINIYFKTVHPHAD